jgi:hypothetical protein
VTFVRCSPILKEKEKEKEKEKAKAKAKAKNNPTKQPITRFAVAGQKYVKKRKRERKNRIISEWISMQQKGKGFLFGRASSARERQSFFLGLWR